MNSDKRAFLVQLLYENFDLLSIVKGNGLNVEVNKAPGLCITDFAFKLESIVHRPVGHSEIWETCRRLQEHGFLLSIKGNGNRKLLDLTPDCKKLFECLDSMDGRKFNGEK